MLFFELRWLLFGFLLIVAATACLAVWLDRLLRRRREKVMLDPAQGRARLEQAPFGLLVLDSSRTCRYANSYARRLLELASSAGPLPEAAWVSLLDQDRVAARQGVPALNCYRTVSLPLDQVIRWWVTSYGDLDILFLLDVTAQQRAEQAAGYLLSDLSHELRTPLATILAHLEVLLLPTISTEIGQQSLRLLKEEARRMARLVNDMLELGGLETSAEIESRPVDLLPLVEGAIAQVALQAGEREIAVSLEADVPLPLVVGDLYRLKQVFLNLLDNTIKYSRPGDRAVVSLRREREGIACAVRDSGPGIPARHLPHVTRRFYRGVPQGEGGSGLGLTLVVEILRRHGSCLEIESQTEGAETGTCVRFVLPALPESKEAAE